MNIELATKIAEAHLRGDRAGAAWEDLDIARRALAAGRELEGANLLLCSLATSVGKEHPAFIYACFLLGRNEEGLVEPGAVEESDGEEERERINELADSRN